MSTSKSIFKLVPSSIEFQENSRKRILEGDLSTPKLYILKDDTYEPPSHQLVGILDHGLYLLFAPIAQRHVDSSVLYTKEYKYDTNDLFTNEEDFVIKLIPQSNLKTFNTLSNGGCIQEYHEQSKKIRVSQCKNSNVTDLIDSIANQDDIFYIHKEHRVNHHSMSSRSQFYDVTKSQVFFNGTRYTGKGSVIVITDTFLDESHAAFFDPNEPLLDQYNVVTSHSKIIAILNGGNTITKRTKRFDGSHGTKVASESVGYPWLTESGVAPNSKLVFIESQASEKMTVPYNYIHTLEQAYLLGARSAGISWTADKGNGQYTYFSYEVDSLQYRLPDLAIAIAVGNDPLQITPPATGKSSATVGPCFGNEMSEFLPVASSLTFSYRDMASFTSRGPTLTGRRAPLFLAPGVKTRGAMSKTIPYPKHLTIFAESGSSFGPSTITGEYALLEEKLKEKSSESLSWMIKNAILISFARAPNRVLVQYGDPPEKEPNELLKQTYGTPIIPNFDTVELSYKDWVDYKGIKELEHQYCYRFDSVGPTRVVLGWNDLNTLSGKIAYRLDLHIFSESEARSSSESTQIYQVVDIVGQTLRIRITSPNRIRYGSSLYYGLAMNRTATEFPCPGSCFTSTKLTNCTDDSSLNKGVQVGYCLHDGNETPCLPLRCHSKGFGPNCIHTANKATPTCELKNGRGFLVDDECLASECEYGYFISNQSSCSCFKGSTAMDETSDRLGICNDLNSYTYEIKSINLDKFAMVSLTSAATHQQFPHLFFFFIFLFIIFVK